MNPKLVHKPTLRDRGELRLFYGMFRLTNGGFGFELGGSFPPRVFNQILKLLTFTVAGLSLHALNAQQSMATQHKISLIFLMFLWYLQEQIY